MSNSIEACKYSNSAHVYSVHVYIIIMYIILTTHMYYEDPCLLMHTHTFNISTQCTHIQ